MLEPCKNYCMGTGGNKFDKYGMKRRTGGRLCLPDPVDDLIAGLLADGETAEQIVRLTAEHGVTAERVEGLEEQPLVERRIAYLRQQKRATEDTSVPSTPDQCLAFVKKKLVALASSADDDKNKITALKALADVAIDERKNPSAPNTNNPAVDLNKLIGGVPDDDHDRSGDGRGHRLNGGDH